METTLRPVQVGRGLRVSHGQHDALIASADVHVVLHPT